MFRCVCWLLNHHLNRMVETCVGCDESGCLSDQPKNLRGDDIDAGRLGQSTAPHWTDVCTCGQRLTGCLDQVKWLAESVLFGSGGCRYRLWASNCIKLSQLSQPTIDTWKIIFDKTCKGLRIVSISFICLHSIFHVVHSPNKQQAPFHSPQILMFLARATQQRCMKASMFPFTAFDTFTDGKYESCLIVVMNWNIASCFQKVQAANHFISSRLDSFRFLQNQQTLFLLPTTLHQSCPWPPCQTYRPSVLGGNHNTKFPRVVQKMKNKSSTPRYANWPRPIGLSRPRMNPNKSQIHPLKKKING